MGGHLPGEKVTPEIAKIRNKPLGEDVISPSRFAEITTREDLRDLVSSLRARSDGRPIGIKIAAGHIERDLEYCVFAEPDFVTIDGRGGATGASPALCGIRQCTDDLRPVPGEKISELCGIGDFTGYYRGAAGVLGFCQGAGYGS